jgi:hypothetical protein
MSTHLSLLSDVLRDQADDITTTAISATAVRSAARRRRVRRASAVGVAAVLASTTVFVVRPWDRPEKLTGVVDAAAVPLAIIDSVKDGNAVWLARVDGELQLCDGRVGGGHGCSTFTDGRSSLVTVVEGDVVVGLLSASADHVDVAVGDSAPMRARSAETADGLTIFAVTDAHPFTPHGFGFRTLRAVARSADGTQLASVQTRGDYDYAQQHRPASPQDVMALGPTRVLSQDKSLTQDVVWVTQDGWSCAGRDLDAGPASTRTELTAGWCGQLGTAGVAALAWTLGEGANGVVIRVPSGTVSATVDGTPLNIGVAGSTTWATTLGGSFAKSARVVVRLSNGAIAYDGSLARITVAGAYA